MILKRDKIKTCYFFKILPNILNNYTNFKKYHPFTSLETYITNYMGWFVLAFIQFMLFIKKKSEFRVIANSLVNLN